MSMGILIFLLLREENYNSKDKGIGLIVRELRRKWSAFLPVGEA